MKKNYLNFHSNLDKIMIEYVFKICVIKVPFNFKNIFYNHATGFPIKRSPTIQL